jgi:hypothetical protein
MCSFVTVLLNCYVSRRKILIGSQFTKNRQLTLVPYVVVLVLDEGFIGDENVGSRNCVC